MNQLTVLNTQPQELVTNRQDGALEVVDTFYTIQGEGPYSGRPAVFVRLAGCILRCNNCDTDYTSNRELVPMEELFRKTTSLFPHSSMLTSGLVVLTGGEPFRQNVIPFIARLLTEGYQVQVETNGSLFPDELIPLYDDWKFSVVCSPKTEHIHPKLLPRVLALKYILDADYVDPDDGLPTSVLGKPIRPFRPSPFKFGYATKVYVQPEDDHSPNWTEKNKRNLRAAVDSCLKHGYRLSLQQHKYLNLP